MLAHISLSTPSLRAMQPICSLRVDHIKFKQAPASLTHRYALQQRHRHVAIQKRNRLVHGPAQQKLPHREVACPDAAVPNIPLPGDNQSAAIFAALRSSDSIDETEDATTKSTDHGTPPPPDDKPKFFIPHRWRIVGMMSLAFVLCNMDKASPSLHAGHSVCPLLKPCEPVSPSILFYDTSWWRRSTCQLLSYPWQRSWAGVQLTVVWSLLHSSGDMH